MTDLPPATHVHRAPLSGPVHGTVALDYEGRFLRRKRLTTQDGQALMVDLPEIVSLNDGDALVLSDGRQIAVTAAPEPLIEVRGDLARLAWHIGNRHTPCRIEADRLLIRHDHVLKGMLAQLGAQVAEVEGPFSPEGGAYGMGRTMGHSHGHDHGHSHGGHTHVHHHGSHRHIEEDEGPDEEARAAGPFGPQDQP